MQANDTKTSAEQYKSQYLKRKTQLQIFRKNV